MMEISSNQIKTSDGFFALATSPFKRYFDFSGRSRRKEYFYYLVFVILVSFGVGVYAGITHADIKVLTDIIQLGVLIPSIAVGVRRMHDTDHSGWWILAPLVNIIFILSKGTVGSNRFGADPKQTTQQLQTA